jgi:hypothetical protein
MSATALSIEDNETCLNNKVGDNTSVNNTNISVFYTENNIPQQNKNNAEEKGKVIFENETEDKSGYGCACRSKMKCIIF